MEAIDKIKSWASALADVGVSLIALGIVLEVLFTGQTIPCLLYTSPSPRDYPGSRMPSSA